MKKQTKRTKLHDEKVVSEKLYPLSEAIDLLKEVKTAKFDETIDIALKLGVDTRKAEQTVRGTCSMPNGLGKEIRVFTRYSSKGEPMDIWDVFYEQRMLGNSRLDPCSKFLKRMPLRKELDRMFPMWKCTSCETMVESLKESIDVEDIDNLQKKKGICLVCMEKDESYIEVVNHAIHCSTKLSEVSKELEQLTKETVAAIPREKSSETAVS